MKPLAVTTMAGAPGESGLVDGDLAAARFYWPASIAIDPRTGNLGVADFYNKKIRHLAGGTVSTIADITSEGVAIDPATGEVIVADWDRHSIVAVDPATGAIRPIAGIGTRGYRDGAAAEAQFSYPGGLWVDGERILVADQDNHCIRAIAGGEVRTVAGTNQPGFVDGALATARFYWPWGLCVEPATGDLLVADSWNHAIRRIREAGDEVTTIAGSGTSGHADGAGRAATFEQPTGLCLLDGGALLVADYCNHCIRRIDLASGDVTTIAGRPRTPGHDDGAALGDATFDYPGCLVLDPETGDIIVADYAGHTLRRLTRHAAPPSTLARARRLVARAVAERRGLAFAIGAAAGAVAAHLL